MRMTVSNIEKVSELSGTQPDLWESDNGIWHIYLVFNANYNEIHIMKQFAEYRIGISNDWYSDWPWVNPDTGKVSYEEDYCGIPKYVKKQFEKLMKEIHYTHGKIFDNPDFDTILAMLKISNPHE